MRTPRTILKRSSPSATGSAASDGPDAAPLEAERDALLVRRDGLTTKLTACVLSYEAAFATRRHLHVTGSDDAAAMRRAEDQVRSVESERAGLEDALRHVSVQIEDAERAIADRNDRAERERVATEIEARVQRIGAAVARLDDAAEAFEAARAELVRVCEEDAPRDFLGNSPALNIVTAAGRLAKILPVGDVEKLLRLPTCAGGAAIPMLNGMKANAAAIRAGEAPAGLPNKPQRPPEPVTIPDEEIVLCRPVSWSGLSGEQHAPSGGVTLPAPVAEAARLAGIGYELGSPDAVSIMAALRREPGHQILKRGADGVWTKPGMPGGEHRSVEPEALFLYLDVDWTASARAAA